MANQTFRAAPMYIEGVKIGEMMQGTYDHQNSGTNVHGLDGVLGVSDGIDETKAEFDAAVPVAGMEFPFRDVMINRKYVTVGIFIDGKMEQITGKVNGRSYSIDSKTGETKGKFTFTGGSPKIT